MNNWNINIPANLIANNKKCFVQQMATNFTYTGGQFSA